MECRELIRWGETLGLGRLENLDEQYIDSTPYIESKNLNDKHKRKEIGKTDFEKCECANQSRRKERDIQYFSKEKKKKGLDSILS